MEMHNGSEYQTIYGRVASYYLVTMAEEPNEKPEQRKAYLFLKSVYETIRDNPLSVGFKETKDCHFEAWKQQNERKNDVKIIRDAFKKVEALIAELFTVLDVSTIETGGLLIPKDMQLSKNLSLLLKALNIANNDLLNMDNELIKGLKELIAISKENIIPITDGPLDPKQYFYFSRGVFETTNWLENAFDRGLNANGEIKRLCALLEERGYSKLLCKDGKRISLDYVKTYGKKPVPVKMSWADKVHYGIELTFEELRLEPYFLWVRMPEFKGVLEHLSEFPPVVSDFIYNHTKTCEGCRYCVQTDKTNTRPLASLQVRDKMKCPLFPSFYLNTRKVTSLLVDEIIATLDACYSGKIIYHR